MSLKLFQKAGKEFINGIKTGTPIAIGYIPGAAAFGILAKTAGLNLWECLFMSTVVCAGASQYVALNLLMAGTAFPEIVFATALINLRHIMLSSALTKRLESNIPALKKLFIFSTITDENFSVAAMHTGRFLPADFVMGINTPGLFTWIAGSGLGWWGTIFLPEALQSCMGIAIYALFTALLIPAVKRSRAALAVSGTAIVLSGLTRLTPVSDYLNRGISIMLVTIIAASAGAYLYPVRRHSTDHE